MGGNKKIKIFEGSCLQPTCLYFVLETNRSQKIYFPNVVLFMFGKSKSRKSKNERRYFGKGTKNRYLKRNSIFYLTRPQFLSFCGYDLNATNRSQLGK